MKDTKIKRKDLQLTPQQQQWRPTDTGIQLTYLKNNDQYKFPFQAKVTFKNEEKNKNISDKQKLSICEEQNPI